MGLDWVWIALVERKARRNGTVLRHGAPRCATVRYGAPRCATVRFSLDETQRAWLQGRSRLYYIV